MTDNGSILYIDLLHQSAYAERKTPTVAWSLQQTVQAPNVLTGENTWLVASFANTSSYSAQTLVFPEGLYDTTALTTRI